MKALIFSFVLLMHVASVYSQLAGSLDNTFAGTGYVKTSLTYGNSAFSALAIQTDGKIVAVGLANSEYAPTTNILRFNTDGSLDNTFGTGGLVTITSGSSNIQVQYPNALVIQADNKIVVGGSYYDHANFYFGLLRCNADGSIDSSFGTNGMVTTSMGQSINQVTALAIQADGKIVAAGFTENSSNLDVFALARYNLTGTLDSTFGTDGKVFTTFGTGGCTAAAMSIQANGKIVVIGTTAGDPNGSIALARYNTDGSLDNIFGTAGRLKTNFIGNCAGQALAIQPDGYIVAAGYTTDINNYTQIVVARFDTTGEFDTNFNKASSNSGVGGWIYTALEDPAAVYGIGLQANGEIVVGGYLSNYLYDDFALVRYQSNGVTDSSFGNNGLVTTDFDNIHSGIEALAIQKDGKIVACGYSNDNSSILNLIVARYNQGAIATGLNETKDENNITVYPNPSSTGSYRLQVSAALVGSQLEIYDEEGQLILSSEIGSAVSEIQTAQAPGVYLLRISSAGATITTKLARL